MNDVYYHIYNRGAHKEAIFLDDFDYQRMLKLLYIANSENAFEIRNLSDINFFEIDRGSNLVEIVAYCLMPNHFHIALKVTDVSHPENITRFLRKLCTGYTNYFNLKYKHSGTILQGASKKKPVFTKDHLDILINYIHLNPFNLDNPSLSKDYKIDHLEDAMKKCARYEYSSYKDYLSVPRQQSKIIASGCVTSVSSKP